MKSNTYTRRNLLQLGMAALAGGGLLLVDRKASHGSELDKVTFQLNWLPQGEHGGWYQAVATGLYKDYGLDVTIQPGGARINAMQLFAGGLATSLNGSNSLVTMRARNEGIPVRTVFSAFQRFPQTLVAHAGVGHDSLEGMKGKPIMMSVGSRGSWFAYLVARYGFSEEQARPYNHGYAEFLADKNAIQQGFITDDGFRLRKQGIDASILLLADYGFNPYGYTIDVLESTLESDPDLVQRFVDATIKGWYSYLKDPAPGNGLIQAANEDQTDDFLAYKLETMEEYGIIDAGDTKTLGIGAMTHERWKKFFEDMVLAELLPADFDHTQAYTLDFVNKRVGLDG